MTTRTTRYGTSYEIPDGLENNYYEMMYDLMDYVKEKGLTTRKAQKLFTDCSDMVLDVKPDEKTDISNPQTIKTEQNEILKDISNGIWRLCGTYVK